MAAPKPTTKLEQCDSGLGERWRPSTQTDAEKNMRRWFVKRLSIPGPRPRAYTLGDVCTTRQLLLPHDYSMQACSYAFQRSRDLTVAVYVGADDVCD